jgi:cytochrome c oxidase cbb3-type subunit 3
MKFSSYLEQIAGVGIYPVISLLLFVAFFTGVMIWIYSIDKKEIEHMENLPLQD